MTKSTDNILEVVGIEAGYPGVPVLKGINCEVERGKIIGLFGHNGAGKTTLLKSIYGVLRRQKGEVRIDGETLSRTDPRTLVRRGIVLVPQGRGVFPSLTVKQHLQMGFWCRPTQTTKEQEHTLERVLDYLPVLRARINDFAGTLSGGQQQMLSIGRALVTEPRLLLLDELSTGLAQNLVLELMALIKQLNQAHGLSVFMIEQNVGAALKIIDRAYLIKTGMIIKNAARDELEDTEALWKLF